MIWTDLSTPEPTDYNVHGKDLMTGIPKIISVSYREIAAALEESAVKIDNAVLKVLEMAPPELASDIYKNGIHTKLPVRIAEDPLQAVVRGTGIALKNIEPIEVY